MSLENSEDDFPNGVDPSKRNHQQAFSTQYVGHPAAQFLAPQLAAVAPMSFPQLAQSLPAMAPADTSMVYHQHGMAMPQNENDIEAKRRRVDAAPMVAVSGMPAGVMLSGQQLAAAAALAIQQQGRSRKKSQVQIDRRRERNRILARRTRLRKKFFFESLQKEVMDLQRENALLKDVVTENIDEVNASKILAGCNAADSLPEGVLEACAEENEMDSQDVTLVKSIQRSQHAFLITDPSLQDNPIVFVSDDFLKVTGYKREQVLGRNCRFLQGEQTSREKVDKVRKSLSAGEDVSVTMLNYMADGTPFWNKLFVAALRDAQNNIVNYIGVTVRVARPEPGDPEHGKLLPGQKPESELGDDEDDDDDDEDDGN